MFQVWVITPMYRVATQQMIFVPQIYIKLTNFKNHLRQPKGRDEIA